MKKLYKIVTNENGVEWDRLVEIKPLGKFSYVNQKEKFDYCIKKSFLAGESYLPGCYLDNNSDTNFGFYLSRYNRYYDRYLSENLKLETLLSNEIRTYYDEGRGNEFKTGKFYSVASSSRFAVSCLSKMSNNGIIELLRKVEINGKIENINVNLEDELHIKGMPNNTTPPLMDVIITTDSRDKYFIEVKCHEIFDTSEHKIIRLKWKYINASHFKRLPLTHENLSKKIVIEDNEEVEYISINGEFLSATNFDCNIATTHFDFKQFICHLLGILSSERKSNNEKIHFYYLFYKNEEYLKIGNAKIYQELENEMSVIFEKFGKLFPEIDFGYCYNNRFDSIKSINKAQY